MMNFILSILAPLVQGVEDDMIRVGDHPLHLGGGIGGCVGMHLPSELLAPHLRLNGPAGADPVQGFADKREEGWQRKGLQGQQDSGAGPLLHHVQDLAVPQEYLLADQVTGGLDCLGESGREIGQRPLVSVRHTLIPAGSR